MRGLALFATWNTRAARAAIDRCYGIPHLREISSREHHQMLRHERADLPGARHRDIALSSRRGSADNLSRVRRLQDKEIAAGLAIRPETVYGTRLRPALRKGRLLLSNERHRRIRPTASRMGLHKRLLR